MAGEDYRQISQTACCRRDAALPAQYKLSAARLPTALQDVTRLSQDLTFFTHDQIQIINAEAEEILHKIHAGIWSSVEVVEAFCRAATLAQQLTNCLTEILFDEALSQARRLDAHLASTGNIVGPLHGLPVSLKDCFITPPHPSSLGMAAYANVPTEPAQESTMPAMLHALGAIVYCKTNLPVAMMMSETDNNVFGPTVNPYHRSLSCGGSSGGEGALIAFRGSPLGIGTDIGGSIRIPAAYCNLYGLRPSSGRYPTLGTRSGIPGQEFILSVNGPMARSLESLVIYSSAILSPAAAPWNLDPKVVPMPWKTESQIQPPGRRLRLAMVGPNDGVVTCHPPVERALNMTRSALEAAGHEVIDWPVDLHLDLVKALGSAFLDFGGSAIMPLLARHNEPVFTSMDGYRVAWEASATTGTGLTPDVMRERNGAKLELMKAYLDRWQATARPAEGKDAIDGIIMAVSPWAAVRSGFTHSKPNMMWVGYTGWVNVLDLPACTFPVTRADAAKDLKRTAFAALNDVDAQIQEDYEPGFYEGAPVGLQLVGQRLREEKLLELVGLVRDSLVASDGIAR